MDDKNMALRVGGGIFLLVAIMHLLRAIYKVQVIVGHTHLRMYLSWFGFAFALVLALWMFSASKK